MKQIYTYSADESYTVKKTLVAAGYTPAGRHAGKELFLDLHTGKQIMVIEKVNPDAWND